MARLARVVAIHVPHHVTQRGNARKCILESDADKLVYINLFRQNRSLYELLPLGYCLMSNHVTAEFVASVEESVGRVLTPQKSGRPARTAASHEQHVLGFD